MPSSVSNWCSKLKSANQKKYTGLHKPVLETMIFFSKKKRERELSFSTPRLLELTGFISDLIHDEIM